MKTKQDNKSVTCQPNQSWLAALIIAVFALILSSVVSSNAQTSPNGDFVNGFDNSTSGVQDSTAGSGYWFNGAGTVTLDTAVKKTGDGSLAVTIPFDNVGSVDQGEWLINFDNANDFGTDIIYDGTQFTNIVFDILMDPSDPLSPNGDYGVAWVGLVNANKSFNNAPASQEFTIPASASTNWFHVSVPVDKNPADVPYLSAPGVIGVFFGYRTYDNPQGSGNAGPSNTFLTNTVKMHIDNLDVVLGAVSNPPPVMSIKKATPGLNFVQGSISSQFDRQNIITLNGGTANYGWAGATAGSPVTYSFTISQFAAPDLNYHIYFYQTAGAGTASAPDFNQPNVLIFQVSPGTNNTGIAALTWKTNSPSSGTISNGFFGSATSITNPALVGTWQLQFTSATGGSVIAPGAISYPFTLDPSVAANIANPITLNFGINPSVDTNTIVGETVVISQISVTGVDPLSSTIATTDNFLNDSALDTNTWQVNALFPASILFVPTNTAFSVGWTLPAVRFSLEDNSSLQNPSSWTVPSSVSSVTLFPGQNALVPKSSLPVGNTGFFRLAKLTATQLQVLWPGETNAPGTVTGKIGTPTPVSLSGGGIVNVTINAVDASFNIVSVSDNVHLTTSNDAITPNDASLVNGTLQQSIIFQSTGAQTVTATDTATGTTILPGTSSPITVTN
jgi:hypothetical protein